MFVPAPTFLLGKAADDLVDGRVGVIQLVLQSVPDHVLTVFEQHVTRDHHQLAVRVRYDHPLAGFLTCAVRPHFQVPAWH